MQKPVKGKTAHQDTDESMVLGILSTVILALTILTVSSYADNQDSPTQQELISENVLPKAQDHTQSYLINTSNNTKEQQDSSILTM